MAELPQPPRRGTPLYYSYIDHVQPLAQMSTHVGQALNTRGLPARQGQPDTYIGRLRELAALDLYAECDKLISVHRNAHSQLMDFLRIPANGLQPPLNVLHCALDFMIHARDIPAAQYVIGAVMQIEEHYQSNLVPYTPTESIPASERCSSLE